MFKVFEYGLMSSPSGWTTWTIHWSDGSVTTEERPCERIRVNCPIFYY